MSHAQQLLQWTAVPTGAGMAPRAAAAATSPRPAAELAPLDTVAAGFDVATLTESAPAVVGEDPSPPEPTTFTAAPATMAGLDLPSDRRESPGQAPRAPVVATERAATNNEALVFADEMDDANDESRAAAVFEYDARRIRVEDVDVSVLVGEPRDSRVSSDDELEGDRVEMRRSSSLWARLADRVTGRERRSVVPVVVRPLRCLATSTSSTADLSLALSPSTPASASFEYWVTKFVRPKLEACGIESLEAFFLDPLIARCREHPRETISVLSLGAATGELEVRLASMARAEGIANFRIDCMATDPASLIPGRELATERQVGAHVNFLHRTLAQWTGGESYALCLAVDVLHRVPQLEATLDRVHRALGADGVLLTIERTGANAHARWPEARMILERIWRLMPARYKTLASNGAVESNFDAPPNDDGDGARAANVLPELMARFHAGTFVAFGNLVEPFVHSRFAGALDPSNEEDRRFIDRVAEIDDAKIDAGTLTPTRIVAAWHTGTVQRTKTWHDRTPEACLRRATGVEA